MELVPVEGEERLDLLVEVTEVIVFVWIFADDLFDHVSEGSETAMICKDSFDLVERFLDRKEMQSLAYSYQVVLPFSW